MPVREVQGHVRPRQTGARRHGQAATYLRPPPGLEAESRPQSLRTVLQNRIRPGSRLDVVPDRHRLRVHVEAAAEERRPVRADPGQIDLAAGTRHLGRAPQPAHRHAEPPVAANGEIHPRMHAVPAVVEGHVRLRRALRLPLAARAVDPRPAAVAVARRRHALPVGRQSVHRQQRRRQRLVEAAMIRPVASEVGVRRFFLFLCLRPRSSGAGFRIASGADPKRAAVCPRCGRALCMRAH